MDGRALRIVEERTLACCACPRLVAYREEVARAKKRAHRAEEYWGRPVPGFGDPAAEIFLLGLAPAAHGANRTGRVFTGDRSGDFLWERLHRAGLASDSRSVSRGDGLFLKGAFLSNAVRCAPPDNRPEREELQRCAAFLREELSALKGVRVVLALGAIAFEAALSTLSRGRLLPRPRPRFAHGVEVAISGAPLLFGVYHPSRQNTQTGRLTAAMFDEVLRAAMKAAERNGRTP